MDVIKIEGETYLVMRKEDLDAIRDDSYREGKLAQYREEHNANNINDTGKVYNQCVISNEEVVIMAHSSDDHRLVLDMSFDGLDDPVKCLLIVNEAISMRDVLSEFIEYSKLGGGNE